MYSNQHKISIFFLEKNAIFNRGQKYFDNSKNFFSLTNLKFEEFLKIKSKFFLKKLNIKHWSTK